MPKALNNKFSKYRSCLGDTRAFRLQPPGHLFHPNRLQLRRISLLRGCFRRGEGLRFDSFRLSPALVTVVRPCSNLLKRAFELPGECSQAPALELYLVRRGGGAFVAADEYYTVSGGLEVNRSLEKTGSTKSDADSSYATRPPTTENDLL